MNNDTITDAAAPAASAAKPLNYAIAIDIRAKWPSAILGLKLDDKSSDRPSKMPSKPAQVLGYK